MTAHTAFLSSGMAVIASAALVIGVVIYNVISLELLDRKLRKKRNG